MNKRSKSNKTKGMNICIVKIKVKRKINKSYIFMWHFDFTGFMDRSSQGYSEELLQTSWKGGHVEHIWWRSQFRVLSWHNGSDNQQSRWYSVHYTDRHRTKQCGYTVRWITSNCYTLCGFSKLPKVYQSSLLPFGFVST